MVRLVQVSYVFLSRSRANTADKCQRKQKLMRTGKTLLARAVAATLNTNFLKVVSSAVSLLHSLCCGVPDYRGIPERARGKEKGRNVMQCEEGIGQGDQGRSKKKGRDEMSGRYDRVEIVTSYASHP